MMKTKTLFNHLYLLSLLCCVRQCAESWEGATVKNVKNDEFNNI